MSTEANDFLDTLLDEYTESNATSIDQEVEEATQDIIPVIELPAGTIDPRLKLLSHSSRTLLHKCPRKYQLYRLSSTQVNLADKLQAEQNVTFAYGSAVGTGVASVLESKTEQQVILDTFLAWDTDLLEENTRQKKSFFLALFAVQKFLALRENDFLEDYELVHYQGKPAVELSFQVLLPEGYRYRGFVDAVLRHRYTGEVMVLECKTSSSVAQPATYKNSGQAVGYSVVLDKMFPDLSSYTVLYLVYESKAYEYKQLPFQKSLLQRALWLQELLIDTQTIELYHSYETYPLHGENCYDFFRDCEYLSLCTLSTENLTKPLTQKILDSIESEKDSYEFTVTFEELVESQMQRVVE